MIGKPDNHKATAPSLVAPAGLPDHGVSEFRPPRFHFATRASHVVSQIWSTGGPQRLHELITGEIESLNERSPLTWAFASCQRACSTVGTTGFEPATP
jgi:hypothetical protein